MKRRSFDLIRVFRTPGDRRRGILRAGPLTLRCALGWGGPVRDKREGDGGTPVAAFRVLGLHYRADRVRRPRTSLPARAIRPDDGWCDDPTAPSYNRPVRLPCRWSHERMWREDRLYDLVLDLAWNRRPVRRGRGSAIFLHAARPGFMPTEGCIAIDRRVIARLVERIGPATRIAVTALTAARRLRALPVKHPAALHRGPARRSTRLAVRRPDAGSSARHSRNGTERAGASL